VRSGFATYQLIICGRKGPASGVLITSPAGIIYARFMHGRWKREYNGFGPAWYFLYVPPTSPCGPRWPAISQPLRRQGLFLSKRGSRCSATCSLTPPHILEHLERLEHLTYGNMLNMLNMLNMINMLKVLN
jgi:hypothetical protein